MKDPYSEERYDSEWAASNPTDPNIQRPIFIMKRSGKRVPFDQEKIEKAISKANAEMISGNESISDDQIKEIASNIRKLALNTGRDLSVEEIQDKVENALMDLQKHDLARAYITYRYSHNEIRKKSELDQKLEGVINVRVQTDGTVSGDNEEVKQENSNKNPVVNSVQRDYMAGEWSRHYVNQYMMPKEIREAHENGILHNHDTDYMANPMHNCDLVNLEDMLQNGTAISGTHIDTPKSFATACTVASQIIAQVASSQYGFHKAAVSKQY